MMEFQQKLEIFPKSVKMVDDGEVMEDGVGGGVPFVAALKVDSILSLGSTLSDLDGDGNGGGSRELGSTS